MYPFHMKGYVAVGLHESAQPGIDIEAWRRAGTQRVPVSEGRRCRKEHGWSREELYQLLLHWSAKETMYKVLDMAEGICNTSKCAL